MITIGELSVSEQALTTLCNKYFVEELAVFGSRARGTHSPGSDLDILVDFFPNSPIGLIEYGRLEEALASLFNVPVDLVSRKGLKPIIRAEVLPEARSIYAAPRSSQIN